MAWAIGLPDRGREGWLTQRKGPLLSLISPGVPKALTRMTQRKPLTPARVRVP